MPRLLRRRQLRELKGISYSPEWMRKLEAAGKFPRRVFLSSNVVAYLEDEIDAWIAAHAAAREDPRPPTLANIAKLKAAHAGLAKANAAKRERRERHAQVEA
jgi:prophage regulatory protein